MREETAVPMSRTQVYLTVEEKNELSRVSAETGRTQSDLIREALDRYLGEQVASTRLERLRSAKGIWKDREDTRPLFAKLRRELDRRAAR